MSRPSAFASDDGEVAETACDVIPAAVISSVIAECSDEAIQPLLRSFPDYFAEPVIGPRLRGPVGSR